MDMRWPWSKTYSIHCPDGTQKTVYRNVDDVFPLYIPGWKGDVSVGASGSGKAIGIDEIKAEVTGAYATKIQGLLFSLDELNQTSMINFRTVYLAFATDPCSHSEFLKRQVERLMAEQERLSRLRIQLRALVEFAKAQPNETVRILAMFKDVAGNIGGSSVADAVAYEINESRELADKWSNNNGS
jgi:hypothetical protein